MTFRTLAAGLLSAVLAVAAIAPLKAQDRTSAIIVLDASNSMWGQIDGRPKIEIAREVMRRVIGQWSSGSELGLVVYGHRRRGDCGDIETVIAPGQVQAEQFMSTVEGIQPRGKTPLTAAIAHAAEELGYREDPATIILLSDGIETCNDDPCSVAADLERRGVNFTAHVIGFDVSGESEQAQLRCVAEATGGRFFTASNADELDRAMGQAARETTQTEEEPEQELEQQATADITLTAPESATAGSEFEVSWTGEIASRRDYVTIVPVGAPDDARGDYSRVQNRDSRNLRAPAETGAYEVRYVVNETKAVAARARIEITEPGVTLTAPEQAVAGSTIDVSWTGAVHPRDYITIVPADAPDDAYDNYVRVQNRESRSLQTPGEPGMYEVRYVLQEGKRVLARQRIEITDAEVTVSAPETAVAGSTITVSWTGAIHPRDYITIVPAGAPDDAYDNYVRVQNRESRDLQVPSETGIYEVRYVQQEDKRVMARQRIEITDATVTVTAPERAVAGSVVDVSWTGAVHPRDYITVVPVGAPDDAYDNYVRVQNRESRGLQMPAEPGMYEVRYVLQEGKRVLARSRIEITAAEITVSAPAQVRANADFEVSWTGEAPHPRDYITIVPVGAGDEEYGDYARVNRGNPATITAPEQTGLYEVRYVQQEGKRVLARARVEVVGENAPIDSGAGLQAPDSAAPGSEIRVTWTIESGGADHRVTIARADQADFTWIEAKSASDGPPVTFTAPDEAGTYEIRYLDLANQEVLGRVRVTVE